MRKTFKENTLQRARASGSPPANKVHRIDETIAVKQTSRGLLPRATPLLGFCSADLPGNLARSALPSPRGSDLRRQPQEHRRRWRSADSVERERHGSEVGRLSPTVFPVNLTQTGGAQGTTTTAAGWRYSVIDPVTNQTLATNVNPSVLPHKWERPSAGWISKATFGYAHCDAQGQLVLGWINEMAEDEACSS